MNPDEGLIAGTAAERSKPMKTRPTRNKRMAVLLTLCMALSLLPVQALAEDAAVGEPVTEIKQAEQTGEGEEPGDPEEEQEPGEPEEPVREFVQGEAQLTVSTAAMAAGTREKDR